MSEKKQAIKEFKAYNFMADPRFMEINYAEDYVSYFIGVKQDTLIQLDAVECGLANAKLNIAQSEAKEILETNFKEVYGKDNEDIRKAHVKKTNKVLTEQLEGYKYQKKVLENQIAVLNDLIDANLVLIGEGSCNCQGD
jgi:hypothetical protein